MTRVLGVDFFDGTLAEALQAAREGGLFVFPSGPGMAGDLLREPAYRAALVAADYAITDSALMVLAHNGMAQDRLPRISGLRFLRGVVEGGDLQQEGAAFWVMPSAADRDHHLRWLNERGLPTGAASTYIAPRYGRGPIADAALLEQVRTARPRFVILAIGGGVQERVGHFLQEHLDFRPAILCIGAAIGFMTGRQARIPPWADRLYLGWLLRCVQSPATFIPRYWNSRHLPWLIWKYGAEMPPLSKQPPAAVGGSF